MNIDALVHPSLLDFKAVLCVVTNVNDVGLVLDFNFADFDAVNIVARILGAGVDLVCAGEFHFKESAVEPESAEV